jgi:hypothetical protein
MSECGSSREGGEKSHQRFGDFRDLDGNLAGVPRSAAPSRSQVRQGRARPPTKDKIGNYLTLGGDALGAIPGFGAVAQGVSDGVRAARGVEGTAAGIKVGITLGAKEVNLAAKAVDPALPLISKPVEAVASKLGASTLNALRISDGVQSTAALAGAAPTAYAAVKPSDGSADAANWGTTLGNVAAGSGGGKVVGGIAVIGSALGLGAWETR